MSLTAKITFWDADKLSRYSVNPVFMKLNRVILTVAATAVVIAGLLAWQYPQGKPVERIDMRSPAGSNSRAGNYKKSSLLAAITNSEVHWEERLREVVRLPQYLDPGLSQGLFDFISAKPKEEIQETWYLVANEIMETLRQRELPAGLYTRKLSALIKSNAVDPVIRDYAIQHLSQWISGAAPDARETDPSLAETAFDLMCEQATATENGKLTLVGTAMNALTDAQLHGQGFILERRQHLQAVALKIASTTDGSVATFNRASALQAAALLDAPKLPEFCRDMAGQDNIAVDLRLSSVAALGLVGDSVDLPMLRNFATDSPFHYAAAAAIRRIEDRVAAR